MHVGGEETSLFVPFGSAAIHKDPTRSVLIQSHTPTAESTENPSRTEPARARRILGTSPS